MVGPDVDVELFRSLERALQSSDVRASGDAVAALLTDDFMEFGSSGRIFDKATVIKALRDETSMAHSPMLELLDFVARALAPDIVLVTYRNVRQSDQRTVLRSSIWKQSEDQWLMLFHQGTVVQQLHENQAITWKAG